MRNWIACGLVAGAVACGSTRPPGASLDYPAKIAADRAAKDAAFLAGNDPIPKARHAEFLPLAYFPIEADYNVPAGLKKGNDPTIIEMPTSTGTNRKMRRAGSLEFSLKGQPLKLTAFSTRRLRPAIRTIWRAVRPLNRKTGRLPTAIGV